MYPALIVVIVNKERSFVHTFGSDIMASNNLNVEGHTKSTEHRPENIGHLVFASQPANSTVDNERSLSVSHSAFPGGPGSSDSRMA